MPSVVTREENTGTENLAYDPVNAPVILARAWDGLLRSVASKPLLLTCITLAVMLMLAPDQAWARATVETAVQEPSSSGGLMEMAKQAVAFVLHLDVHLVELVAKYGAATYAIVFAIVFAETGLVVTPFLPGDSLLFATGALAGLGKLNLLALLALYATAATIGDAVNYSGMCTFPTVLLITLDVCMEHLNTKRTFFCFAVGKYFGKKAIESKVIKAEYIAQTEKFYAKYGGKTIVIARFVPIVRTFAPFVAGVGSMAYRTFAVYNVLGALLWTGVCVGAGFVFGNIPIVQQNFSLVVLGIIAVSVLPMLYEIGMAWKEKAKKTLSGRSGIVSRNGGSLQVSFQ
jgi:membrane-associated protein